MSTAAFARAFSLLEPRSHRPRRCARKTGQARVSFPSGRYLDFTYDTANCISRIQDFTGRAVDYTYSAAGYLTRATYPDGSFEDYGYDASNRMTAGTLAEASEANNAASLAITLPPKP